MINKLNKMILCIVLLIISITVNIYLDSYIVFNRAIRTDQEQHFYDIKRWYESGKIPVTSTRFTNSRTIDDEFVTGRVPGGAYYIFYKLASENLIGAKIINLLFSLSIFFIFLFWFYKKYGLFITSIIGSLILMNPYFIISLTDLWNPNLALIFSFLLFIFLYEYIDSKNENIVRFSVVIIFPIIALISQLHFFTFFSVVPTIIIYLLIRFKRTKQYLTFWVIGVFLSFLQYVPYLMYELQSGFLNMKNIIKTIYDDSNGGMDVNLISIYGERKETYCDISKNLFSEYAWNCNNNGTNLYILIDFIKLNNSDDPAYPKYINYLASNSKLIYTNEYILVYKFQHSNDELLSPENFI